MKSPCDMFSIKNVIGHENFLPFFFSLSREGKNAKSGVFHAGNHMSKNIIATSCPLRPPDPPVSSLMQP